MYLLLLIISSAFIDFAISTQILFPTDEPETNINSFGRCLSPDKKNGECLYLYDCAFLFTLLSKKPLLDHEKDYLSQSQCGYYNSSPLVCCLTGGVQPNITNPNATPSPPSSTPKTRPDQGSSSLTAGTLPEPGVCGGGTSDRIYGGNRTQIGEYPWIVLLQYSKPNNKKGFHCGGSLINNRYVITASHCVNGKAIPTNWKLSHCRLGEWDLNTERDCEFEDDCADPVQDVAIESQIPHELYNPNSKNQLHDIALLRLSIWVQYTDFIKPVCMPTADHLKNMNFVGQGMDVAGWGKTEVSSVSNIKLKARVNGVGLDECNIIYRKQSVILEETQLCAGGEKGIDSCRGDSGGPLILVDRNKGRPYYFLAGVVSFGPVPCGLQGWPGVYTKINKYVDWIKRNIHD